MQPSTLAEVSSTNRHRGRLLSNEHPSTLCHEGGSQGAGAAPCSISLRCHPLPFNYISHLGIQAATWPFINTPLEWKILNSSLALHWGWWREEAWGGLRAGGEPLAAGLSLVGSEPVPCPSRVGVRIWCWIYNFGKPQSRGRDSFPHTAGPRGCGKGSSSPRGPWPLHSPQKGDASSCNAAARSETGRTMQKTYLFSSKSLKAASCIGQESFPNNCRLWES